MNITFEESVYCNEKGEHYRMDNFMVRFRQILYIQIPDNVSITCFLFTFSYKPPTQHNLMKKKREEENSLKKKFIGI